MLRSFLLKGVSTLLREEGYYHKEKESLIPTANVWLNF